MKLWFDDTTEPPSGYIWCTKPFILKAYLLGNWDSIQELNMGYAKRLFSSQDSDTINMLKWVEETTKQGAQWYNVNWSFAFHGCSIEQREEIENIITRNRWKLKED